MNAVAIIVLLVKISVMLIVCAIGMNATLADATYLFRRPAQLFKALLSMYVVLPLFALLVTVVFDLNAAVEIALVVLSISPVPPILPNKALKAGGEENYTIGILVATALLSVVLIPVAIKLTEVFQSLTLTIAMRSVVTAVLTSVILPLGAGILLRRVAPSLTQRLARYFSVIGTVMLVVAAIPVLIVTAPEFFTLVGEGTLLALAALAVVGLISGHLLGGPDPDNRPVLAMATSSRHPAIALAIAHANFPNQKLVAPCVLAYIILTTLLGLVYLTWRKRTQVTPGEPGKPVPT
jgi:bile acid:Na+ symporter, BASS family